MGTKYLFSLLAILLIAGCSSGEPLLVPEAVGVEPVSGLSMSCKKPNAFIHDCSMWSGATKKVSLDDFPFKVAGTEDGKTTLLMAGGSVSPGDKPNIAYQLVKREFANRDIEILTVVPVTGGGNVFGYIIETAEPAYQIWDEFAE